MFTVRVPASSSNLGAGFDCLGVALDLWLEARLVPGSGDPIYTGTLAGLDPDDDLILHLLGGERRGRFHLEAHSDIPIGKGLGSSAAAVVAGAILLQLAAGGQLDRDRAFGAGLLAEGHPDNAGPAVYGGLVLAAQRPVKLRLHERLGIALSVPEKGIDTKMARKLLPEHFPRSSMIEQAARAAALVQGLVRGEGDLITYGMEDMLAVPHRKHLIPGYDQAVEAGIEFGAHGVTISGAGSTLIAIAPHAKVAEIADMMTEALLHAGNPAKPMTPNAIEQGATVPA